MFGKNKKLPYICTAFAEIAQLVERNLAKVEVAGSSLVFRSVVCTKTPSFKNKLGVFLFYVIVLIIA